VTSAERPIDHNEAVNDFLKLHEQELEFQAIKLMGFYPGVDLHELLSQTAETIWEKWASEFCVLPHDEIHKYALRVMYNHALNLSKKTRRHWSKFDYLPGEQLESPACAAEPWLDPAIEAIFRDESLAIYRAISQLNGRSKDVMVLVALGLENSEIRQELGLTVTNLTSILGRARKSLRKILGLVDRCEGGDRDEWTERQA
jgi:DNA-directed RNA polymerase specialized sigma24 family protein